MIDEARREGGFDPAAPVPPKDESNLSPEEAVASSKYHNLLGYLLDSHLNGSHGPDLAHAFHRGRLDARAIYDSIAAHLPGAAADDTLRIALFRHLAPLDPVRAAVLLDSRPEDQATRLKYETLSVGTGGYTPDTAFALLSTIPVPADGSGDAHRKSLGIETARHFSQIYGSDLLPWVEQLPAGSYRHGVAAALLGELKDSDLPGYRRMRALISDPDQLEAFPPR